MSGERIKLFSSPNAPAAVGPYSHGAVHGNVLYCSGVIPLDPATGLIVEGDVKVQAERVLENLGLVLKDAGVGYGDVIKNTVFITDMNDFPAVNEIYGKYFNRGKPARSCVEVSGLPKGALIEIESVVALG